jgi:hypothetical protein
MDNLLKFVANMDPHSLDVVRPTPQGPRMIAYLQWHPGREPRFIPLPLGAGEHFTLAEMQQMVAELTKKVRR